MPIVIADHAFNKDGSFRYEENVDLGFRGDTILVNGAVSPRMSVQRRKYRLRFLNASNARSYALRLGDGPPMTADRRRRRAARAAGRRARGSRSTPPSASTSCSTSRDYGPGEELVLHNDDGLGGTVPIMRFDVEGGGASEDFTVPSRMREPERAAGRQRPPPLGSRARQRRVADQRPGL